MTEIENLLMQAMRDFESAYNRDIGLLSNQLIACTNKLETLTEDMLTIENSLASYIEHIDQLSSQLKSALDN